MKIEFKKKYLVVTVVVLLLLFSMNRCTVACNRSRDIVKSEYVIDSLNNHVRSLEAQVELLEKDTTYLRSELKSMGVTNKDLLDKVSKQQVVHNHYTRK